MVVFVGWCFCGGVCVVVFVWCCFVLVFVWWCLCGGVFVVVFLRSCGGVFAFLWWCLCGGVFAFLWWCLCGGVSVVVFVWCFFLVVFVWWCFCDGVLVVVFESSQHIARVIRTKVQSIKVVTNHSIGTCSVDLYVLYLFETFRHRLVRYYWYIFA